MHIVILSLLAAAIAFAGFGPAYAASSFRSSVTVNGPDVRVDDIFPGAESKVVVAKTPAPGRRLVFDAYTLSRIARNHNIDWRPQTRFAQSVISRESRTLEAPEIEDALFRALKANGLSEDRRIEMTNRSMNVQVATNLATAYEIENPVFDAQSQHASAVLVVAADGADPLRYRIDATTYSVIDIPVLNRRIRRGEKIEPADVIWKSVRQDSAGRNVILDRDSVVGQAARRFLADGRPLNIDDIEPPILVRKGGLVTIFFETSNLELSAKARANDDGAMNDTIRVVNIRSKKVIEAVVRGPTTVVVPNGSRNLAN